MKRAFMRCLSMLMCLMMLWGVCSVALAAVSIGEKWGYISIVKGTK